jgi:hypothetical protein
MAATAIRSGVKTYGDGDTWVNWWLLPRVSDEVIKDFCEENDIVREYNGPGCQFAHKAGYRHSRSYTLVTQWAGYDV